MGIQVGGFGAHAFCLCKDGVSICAGCNPLESGQDELIFMVVHLVAFSERSNFARHASTNMRFINVKNSFIILWFGYYYMNER